MSEIEVRELTKSEFIQWDQLVYQSEQGSIFHSSQWIIISAKCLHLDYKIIGAYKDSKLIGGCFFYIRTVLFFKIATTAIDLAPYGGMVLDDQKYKNVRRVDIRTHEIISLIINKIELLKLSHIKLVNNWGLKDIRSFTQNMWRENVLYTYIVPLNGDIFSNLSGNARRSIRKAQSMKISIIKEYNPTVFWELTELTYKKQNLNVPFKKELLISLMEMLHENELGEMWIAKTPMNESISAIFTLFDRNLAHGWVGANNPKFINSGVVSLLLFEILQDLQKRGFHKMNIMAGNTQNLSQFYSTFNPILVPYYSVQKSRGLFYILSTVKQIIKNNILW